MIEIVAAVMVGAIFGFVLCAILTVNKICYLENKIERLENDAVLSVNKICDLINERKRIQNSEK